MANGGIGNMLFGQGGGGFGVPGGKIGPPVQSTQGLFGSGGQFGMSQTMSTIGMGLGLAQAFGKDATGSAITQTVPLSKEGKKLKTSLLEDTKAKLTGANLAEPYVRAYVSAQKGRLKRQAGAQTRALRGITGELASRDVRTGRGMGALVASAGQRIEGGAAPAKWESEFIRGERAKGISGLQNIRNIELQTALLKASGGFAKTEIGRMRGATQGQALGDLARYLAYQKYPMY
jgi:hypothetical protein